MCKTRKVIIKLMIILLLVCCYYYYSFSYIFEYLGKAGITTETHVVLIDQCSQAIASLTSDQSLHRTSTYLQKFLEAIKV